MKSKIRKIKASLRLSMNRIRLPGMQGMGLYSVLKFFWNGLNDPSLQVGSMAVAYRFFFSLFPGLMIIFTLTSLLPIENIQTILLNSLSNVLPAENGLALVQGIATGSGVGLFSINILLLLISAMGAIKVLIHAFYRNDEFVVRQTFLRLNLAALGIFFLLVLIFIFTSALMVGGEYLVAKFSEQGSTPQIAGLKIIHFFIVLISLISAVSVLYHFGPETSGDFSFISPGSVMGGILIYVAIFLFRTFVNLVFNFELYAGLSTIMVLMIWFQWVSFVILAGFELNRAIARLKRMQALDE